MGHVSHPRKRIALPSDAIVLRKHDVHTDKPGDTVDSNTPVRLWDCFEDWLQGVSIDVIADRLNVTMREMDEILRQLVTEKITNVQRKSHARNTARKEQTKSQRYQSDSKRISRTTEANINRELEKAFEQTRTKD